MHVCFKGILLDFGETDNKAPDGDALNLLLLDKDIIKSVTNSWPELFTATIL